MISPLAIAALAGGTALVIHESGKGAAKVKAVTSPASSGRMALDPGMDSLIAEAVSLAIQSETDPTALKNFALLLQQAGFQNSATAVSAAASKGQGK